MYQELYEICMNLGHILNKYGWNHSLDNKVMNFYLTVSLSPPMWSTSPLILLYFQRGVVKCFVFFVSFYISFNGNNYCHLFVKLVSLVQVMTINLL